MHVIFSCCFCLYWYFDLVNNTMLSLFCNQVHCYYTTSTTITATSPTTITILTFFLFRPTNSCMYGMPDLILITAILAFVSSFFVSSKVFCWRFLAGKIAIFSVCYRTLVSVFLLKCCPITQCNITFSTTNVKNIFSLLVVL